MLRFPRSKQRVWLLTFCYRLNKLLFFLGRRWRLSLFLDLEWIFSRLAIEEGSRFFSSQQHPLRKSSLRFMSQVIDNTTSVLDLGCKDGDLSALIASIAKEVVAVDYDPDAVKAAQGRNHRRNLLFVCDDALSFLGKCDRRFDVIVLSHILEHFDNPEDLLVRLKQFSRYFYIEVPDFDMSYLNHFRLETANALLYTDNDHITEFDRDSLRELIAKANLTVLTEEFRHGVLRVICEA